MCRTLALAEQISRRGCLFLILGAATMLPIALAENIAVPEPGNNVEGGAAQQAAGGDDWDWGSDWDVTPTAPAYKDDVSKTREMSAKTAESPAVPRVGETAEPDFSRNPLSGHVLFAGVPAFGVIPSKRDPDMHPCADCHTWAVSNLEPRKMLEPHDNFLLQHGLHGKGEFWCFTCHDLDGKGGIRTLEGEKLAFDDAYIVCAQCHPREAEDWSFGAHGKRVENWRGERRILNCTACHYQHSPAIKPRRAEPPPPVRRGLAHNEHKPLPEEPLWKQIEKRYRRLNTASEP